LLKDAIEAILSFSGSNGRYGWLLANELNFRDHINDDLSVDSQCCEQQARSPLPTARRVRRAGAAPTRRASTMALWLLLKLVKLTRDEITSLLQ